MSEPHGSRVSGELDPQRTTPEERGDLAATMPFPPTIEPSPAPKAGRYSILGEVGRGGMGAVLLGRDEEMGRDLAIKILHSDSPSPEAERRFLEEARLSGRLQHPGIVPVYELGRFEDQRPYFTMKLVQGRTLKAILTERKSPAEDLPRLLKVFEQICQTMAYAHSRRVIHRDLKPHNVMVGEFGEVQVMDWGLAKVLDRSGGDGLPDEGKTAAFSDSSSEHTQAGAVLGTPAYMAPEQARGEIAHVDERADVFGLGAILCEILTGQAPFPGPARKEVWKRAANADLGDAFSRLDGSRADAELVALARSCLAPEAAQRPRDAGAVNQAMAGYLAGVQERLRTAEIEKAAAEARAAEAKAKAAAERRSRRLTLALAASVLAVGGLLAGGWIWFDGQRALADEAVNVALRDAVRLHEKARANQSDYPLPDWTNALTAVQKARALAETGLVSPGIREHVATVFAQVEEGERLVRERQDGRNKENTFRYTVERTHLHIFAESPTGKHQFWERAKEFKQAFLAAGLDVDQASVEEAAEWVKARRPETTTAMVAALDQWAFTEWAGFWSDRSESAQNRTKWDLKTTLIVFRAPEAAASLEKWRRRLRIARLADPDPVRNNLRDALTRLDLPRFKEIIAAEDASRLPGPTVQIAAVILIWMGEPKQAAVLLARALPAHPRDAPLQVLLGDLCMGWVPREAPAPSPENTVPENHTRALECYNNAAQVTEQFGGDELVQVKLAVVRHHLGQTEDAIRSLQAFLEKHPYAASARHRLSTLLLAVGKVDGAVEHGKQAMQQVPASARFHFDYAQALQAKKDHQQALTEFFGATQLDPANPGYHLRFGLALKERRASGQAMTELRTAVKLDKSLSEGWIALAGLVKERSGAEAAIEVLREPLRLGADAAVLRNALGKELLQQEKVDLAAAEFREALRLDPGLKEAKDNLALVLNRNPNLPGPGTTPGTAAGWQMLGDQQRFKGEIDRALASYRQAIKLQGDNADAWVGLGWALRQKRQLTEARDALRQAVRLDPKNGSAQTALGWVCLDLNDADEALAAFKEAVQTADSMIARQGLGRACLLRGDTDNAIASLKAAVEKAPTNDQVLCDYARALRSGKKLAEAEAACRDAIKHYSNNAVAHSLLGQVLADQEKWKESLDALQESMRKVKSMETAALIADALYRRGSPDEAIAYLTGPAELWPAQTAGAYTAMLVKDGKEKELRTCCEALVKRFGSTTNGWEAFWTARCLAQSPHTGASPHEAIRLAEVAVNSDRSWGGACGALALAHYRAEQFEKAIEQASESIKKKGYPSPNWLVLAMAHHRLGHTEEAKSWFDKAVKEPGTVAMNPQDRAFYELLRLEAEGLFKSGG